MQTPIRSLHTGLLAAQQVGEIHIDIFVFMYVYTHTQTIGLLLYKQQEETKSLSLQTCTLKPTKQKGVRKKKKGN